MGDVEMVPRVCENSSGGRLRRIQKVLGSAAWWCDAEEDGERVLYILSSVNQKWALQECMGTNLCSAKWQRMSAQRAKSYPVDYSRECLKTRLCRAEWQWMNRVCKTFSHRPIQGVTLNARGARRSKREE